MKIKNIMFGFVFVLIIVLPAVMGAAEFAVNTFSCTPSEVVINDVFSCTATLKNNGDAAGSVSTATIYTDSNDWLEDSNYPQVSGTSVDPGQTTEVTFTGLRSIKSGNNGFSKIMLDSVTDTYVADSNIKENVIDVTVTVSDSSSSATKSTDFTSTSEITAGGNIDVTLTFTVDSGGCSIGNQGSQKTITGMNNGNKQSRTWTVTMGTSGNCKYTVSAAATGTEGIASEIDSSSSTVTCTGCSSSSDSSSSGGGGGGGGGGGAATAETSYQLGELKSAQAVDLGINEKATFSVLGADHSITLNNVTETQAIITVESSPQKETFNIEDEKNFDLDIDGKSDINIKLKSINIITKKARFIISPLFEANPEDSGSKTDGKEGQDKKEAGFLPFDISGGNLWFWIIIMITILILAVIILLLKRRKNKL